MSLSLFEKISTLLMKLGRSSTANGDLAALFPPDRDLQIILCEYLITTVNFCTKTVSFTQKSALAQLTSSFTQSYDSYLKTFEAELQNWSGLIDRRVIVLLGQSQLKTASAIIKASQGIGFLSSKSKREEAIQTRKGKILQLLCPLQPVFELEWRRQRKKGSPQWLFNEQPYRD